MRARSTPAGDFVDTTLAHEQCRESEHEAIKGGQIRRALPGSIADQKLLFEQQGFCDDRADATGTAELRDRDQQVDGENDEFAHAANRTIIAAVRKAAREDRIHSYYEFATHRRAISAAN